LIPYIAACQDLPTIGEQLKNRDVCFRTDFISKVHTKPDNNAEILNEYIRIVYLPILNDRRSLDQFADEDVVRLMDDCPRHVSEEIINLLLDARVLIIT
jgi:hypothetical protein